MTPAQFLLLMNPSRSAASAPAFPLLTGWTTRYTDPATTLYTDAGTTLVAATGNVPAQWNDSSGNANHLTITAGTGVTPKYISASGLTGEPCLSLPYQYNGKPTLPAISTASRDFSAYFILRPYSTGNDSYALFNLGSDAALNSPMMDFANGVLRTYLPLASSTQRQYGNPIVIAVVGSATDVKIYVNNAVQTLTGEYDNATVTGGVLLHRGDGYNWYGEVYEMGIRAGALSAGDVANIVDYAETRYGLVEAYTKLLAVSGNSIAQGHLALNGGSWPTLFGNANPTWKVIPAGVAGQTLATLHTTYAPFAVTPYYDASHAKNIYVQTAGTNDIQIDGVTLATLKTRWQTDMTARGTTGFYRIGCTILPRADAPWTGGMETIRQGFNSYMLASGVSEGYCEAVYDFAALPEADDPNDLLYYQSDKLHATELLRVALAAGIGPTILAT